jgi:hypothetical protein
MSITGNVSTWFKLSNTYLHMEFMITISISQPCSLVAGCLGQDACCANGTTT